MSGGHTPLPRTPAIHLLILLGAVGLAYGNALIGSFQFDDYNVIVFNQAVQSWPAWWQDAAHGVRPLLKASYTVNWTTDRDGSGPFGFHLFNLLVHAGNAWLIYRLSRRILTRTNALPPDRTGEAGLLTSLVFALHPVQTEAVTYVSGRSASLMALYYLGSLLTYVQGRDQQRPVRLYGLSPFLFVCALSVKETAVTLPVALLLWEWVERSAGSVHGGRADGPSWSAVLRRQAAHWLILFGMVVWLLIHPRYEWLLTFSLHIRSVSDNLLTQMHGIAYLLSHLLLIAPPNIDPDLPVMTHWTGRSMVEAGGWALLVAVGVRSVRRRPWLTFGILWFFLHLLPTNSIFPRLDVANDRHLYLAGWGLFLIGAVAASKGATSWKSRRLPEELGRESGHGLRVTGLTAATLVLSLALGWLTVVRNADYRTEIALWERTTLLSPSKARVWNNLGYAYFLAGRYDDARVAYGTALRLDPQFVLARNNLAALLNTTDMAPLRARGMSLKL